MYSEFWVVLAFARERLCSFKILALLTLICHAFESIIVRARGLGTQHMRAYSFSRLVNMRLTLPIDAKSARTVTIFVVLF